MFLGQGKSSCRSGAQTATSLGTRINAPETALEGTLVSQSRHHQENGLLRLAVSGTQPGWDVTQRSPRV